MPPANVGPVAALGEPREGELSNRLQHPEAPLRVAGDSVHQAVRDEGTEDIEHVAEVIVAIGHFHHCLDRPLPGEDRQAAEEDSRRVVDEVMTPRDSGLERSLPLRRVPRSADEHREGRLEPFEELSGREDPDA